MLKTRVFKKKKVPPEKFLVVVNTWGLGQGSDFRTEDFNNIGAWFEFMLRGDYPSVGIQAVYYQRTHRNIIVELPADVKDISNLLGRHYYRQFLTHSPQSEKFADVYEYKYAVHGDPSEKNWSIGYPDYKAIPQGIPLAFPYPCPGTADPPPIDVADYAYPVPPSVYERRLERLASELRRQPAVEPAQSTPARSESSPAYGSPNNVASSRIVCSDKGKERVMDPSSLQKATASGSLYTPYSPPSHLTASLKGSVNSQAEASSSSSIVKKMDPYEEEELAAQSLFSSKTEPKDEAEDFLLSLMGNPKEEYDEASVEPKAEEDDYEPSAELLAMLGTLPPGLNPGISPQHDEPPEEEFDIRVKPEPMDETIPDSEYTPSAELLAMMASLPQDLLSNGNHEEAQVKNEFNIDIKLKTEQAPVKIKQEGQSFSIPNPIVKSEPIDDERAFDFQSRDYRQGPSSRDPRIRRRETSDVSENKRRNSPPLYGYSKRVKMEEDQ